MLGNDAGLEDVPVPVTLVSGPTYAADGGFTLNDDGTFIYVHDGSENFTDSFTYRVTDNDSESSAATVNITITNVSDTTPVAANDSFTVAEGGTFDTTGAEPLDLLDSESASVLGNDAGLEDVPVPVTLVSGPTYAADGGFTLNDDGTFIYVHDGSENFTDSFTYRVTDNDSSPAPPPSTSRSPTSAIPPRSRRTTVSRSLKAAPSTPPVQNHSTCWIPSPPACSVTTPASKTSRSRSPWSAARPMPRTVDSRSTTTAPSSTCTTAARTSRTASPTGSPITTVESSDATVNITITNVSDTTPVAANDSFTVAEGGTFDTTGAEPLDLLDSESASVLGNDAGLEDVPVPVTLVSGPTYAADGGFTLNDDGTFIYVHDGSENFTDSFTYRVTDNDSRVQRRHRQHHDHQRQRYHPGRGERQFHGR